MNTKGTASARLVRSMVMFALLSIAAMSCATANQGTPISSEGATRATRTMDAHDDEESLPASEAVESFRPQPTSSPHSPTGHTPQAVTVTEDPADATFEEARVAGQTLRCFPPHAQQQRCYQTTSTGEPSGLPDAYCEPEACAELWFPSELRGIDIAETYQGQYACAAAPVQGEYLPCEAWGGHEPPPTVNDRNAEVWCDDHECVPYDGDSWTAIVWRGRDYICDLSLDYTRPDGLECYVGDTPPVQPVFTNPDLFCDKWFISGSPEECSELWYPQELDDYTLVEDRSTYLLCRSVGLQRYHCGDYDGGDPSRVYFAVYCYGEGFGSVRCGGPPPDYEVVRIEGREFWCTDTFDGSECYTPTEDGSPPRGSPNYFCGRLGMCGRSRY